MSANVNLSFSWTRLWYLSSWFVLALLVAVISGSILQTQFNLAALMQLGVAISWTDWIATVGDDLTGFSPLLSLIMLLVYAIAFPVAAALARRFTQTTGALRGWLFALAGGAGFLVAMLLVDALAPMPTLIAATRSWAGLLAMALASALGGWVFSRHNQQGFKDE